MNILKLIILLCFTFSAAFGQRKDLILTDDQNSKWLDSLNKSSSDQQLVIIKDRLLADTNVFIKQSYPDGIKVVEQLGNRVYGYGKPTIIIGIYPMIIDNKTEIKRILGLADLLTKEYIKEISILTDSDPVATTLYGRSALSGMIIMKVTKKKYLKKFRRLKLKSNY